MSRPYIYMEAGQGLASPDEVRKLRDSVVEHLCAYLGDYRPERWGESKSSLVGPVGKLISAVSSGRFAEADAIVGFVANIHSNTSKTKLSQKGYDHLKAGVEALRQLKEKVSPRDWLRLLREIDYAVFAAQYERVAKFFEEIREAKQAR